MIELDKKIREVVPECRILKNIPLSQYTSFRIGGPAEYLVNPSTVKEVTTLIEFLASEGIPAGVLGRGTNVLIPDEGVRGVVVRIARNLSGFRIDLPENGVSMDAYAGTLLSLLASEAGRKGISGMEYAAGIPGSIGGAVIMNAGAYGGEICKNIVSLQTLDKSGGIKRYNAEKLSFGYRWCELRDKREIVLSVRLGTGLKIMDPEKIRSLMMTLSAKRRERQPLERPSAGSVFKKTAGKPAGWFIEQAGLKGFRLGGCEFSAKHANFIVNLGNGSAKDVMELMELAMERVFSIFSIELQPEIVLFNTAPLS